MSVQKSSFVFNTTYLSKVEPEVEAGKVERLQFVIQRIVEGKVEPNYLAEDNKLALRKIVNMLSTVFRWPKEKRSTIDAIAVRVMQLFFAAGLFKNGGYKELPSINIKCKDGTTLSISRAILYSISPYFREKHHAQNESDFTLDIDEKTKIELENYLYERKLSPNEDQYFSLLQVSEKLQYEELQKALFKATEERLSKDTNWFIGLSYRYTFISQEEFDALQKRCLQCRLVEFGYDWQISQPLFLKTADWTLFQNYKLKALLRHFCNGFQVSSLDDITTLENLSFTEKSFLSCIKELQMDQTFSLAEVKLPNLEFIHLSIDSKREKSLTTEEKEEFLQTLKMPPTHLWLPQEQQTGRLTFEKFAIDSLLFKAAQSEIDSGEMALLEKILGEIHRSITSKESNELNPALGIPVVRLLNQACRKESLRNKICRYEPAIKLMDQFIQQKLLQNVFPDARTDQYIHYLSSDGTSFSGYTRIHTAALYFFNEKGLIPFNIRLPEKVALAFKEYLYTHKLPQDISTETIFALLQLNNTYQDQPFQKACLEKLKSSSDKILGSEGQPILKTENWWLIQEIQFTSFGFSINSEQDVIILENLSIRDPSWVRSIREFHIHYLAPLNAIIFSSQTKIVIDSKILTSKTSFLDSEELQFASSETLRREQSNEPLISNLRSLQLPNGLSIHITNLSRETKNFLEDSLKSSDE